MAAGLRSLLNSFDSLRRDVDTSSVMEGLDSYKTRAFEMVTSGAVRKALDLTREDPKTVDRYDANNRDFFTQGGDKFLLARRLVEAGVGCVTIGFGGYDTHASQFQGAARQTARDRSRPGESGPGSPRPRHG